MSDDIIIVDGQPCINLDEPPRWRIVNFKLGEGGLSEALEFMKKIFDNNGS